jgi:hypothetical protein
MEFSLVFFSISSNGCGGGVVVVVVVVVVKVASKNARNDW